MKQIANISIWTRGLKCDNGFDLGLDIDIGNFKVTCDLNHLVTKVRRKVIPDSDRGDFRCRRDVHSSSLLHVDIIFLLIIVSLANVDDNFMLDN